MKAKLNILAVFLVLFSTNAFSIENPDSLAHNHNYEENSKDLKKEIKQTIKHHLKDAHYFELYHGVKMPLPVIFWDNGLKVYSSSNFKKTKVKFISINDTVLGFEERAKKEIVSDEKKDYLYEFKESNYSIFHGKIYPALHQDFRFKVQDNGYKKLVSHSSFIDFSITKNVLVIILMSIFLLFTFSKLARSYKKGPIPSGFGRILEPLILFVRDDIAIPNIGEKHYKKYMSYLLTVFFFIWFLNLSGMLPLGINVTGSIVVTFSLALITYLITQFTANKNYWGHIFWMPGVPVLMKIVLLPIELLGTIIKPFSLMIRLYANITAGHVVLMSLIGLIYAAQHWLANGAFFGLTLFLGVIELLVAFLQAYIFTMLTALYFGSAVEEHH
jgi:F-type H+-transporting ATPase subunit a